MKQQKLVYILICMLLWQGALKAQKTISKLGTITAQDFILPASACIDSNTGAVILADIGDLHFEGNDKGWFSWIFKRQKRIKIISQKAFEAAKLNIPFYKSDYLKIYDLNALTYNLENGVIKKTVLSPNDIYEEKLSRHLFEKKFTAPAVKEGSIIEYTYTLRAASDDLPSWQFQDSRYPCLWSELRVSIPKLLHYVFAKQGIHDFCVDEGGDGKEGYKVTSQNTGDLLFRDYNVMVTDKTVNRRWAMKDIPAFTDGNYISTAANYIDKLEFQMSGYFDGVDKYSQTNSWPRATAELSQDAYFGKPLRQDKSWLDNLLRNITGNLPDQFGKARAIYYYVSSNFICTNYNDYNITTTLQDLISKKSGTVGDINLLLTAMLLEEGISADPVLLSTRNFGFNAPGYPLLKRFNYVICKTTINSKIYYLDASHTELGFGQLPGECYNGHARIISLLDSGSVYFYADSLKERKITMVSINTNDRGGMEGSYQSTRGYQESYDTRKTIKAAEDKKNFFKTIQTSYGSDLEIRNGEIDSLNKPEFPVKVHYDFNLKQTLGSPIIYLNPMFAEALHENPFPAEERKYPIEMSHATDELYTFTMDIPDGYTVDELPKSARIAYNGNEGLFEYLIARQENSIQLRCRIKLDRAQFPAEDYNSLRDFFAFIVKKQGEEIVLKKQN